MQRDASACRNVFFETIMNRLNTCKTQDRVINESRRRVNKRGRQQLVHVMYTLEI